MNSHLLRIKIKLLIIIIPILIEKNNNLHILVIVLDFYYLKYYSFNLISKNKINLILLFFLPAHT